MKQVIPKEASLTYDDIQLRPQYSEILSRSNVDLESDFTRNYRLKLPFVASPMDTVCGIDMAAKMMKLGGVGIIHRFMSVSQQTHIIEKLFLLRAHQDISEVWGNLTIPRAAAVGVGEEEFARANSLIRAGANVILIDVAHGHHKNVKIMIEVLTKFRESSGLKFDIIAGNVATYQGTKDLCDWGVDGVRVGVGGGSLCTTRLETGHGVPNVTSIIESVEASSVPVMADGGIRRAGDVAKAIGLGASNVMLGSLLAGTNETPGPVMEGKDGLFKRYRGSASIETKNAHGQKTSHVEGESTVIPYKGGVKFVINRLEDGLRSALSYTGSSTILGYQSRSKFVQITNAGITESKPHLK